MGYWLILVGSCFALAIFDTLVEVFFQSDLLLNFSLVSVVANLLFFVFAMVLWVGLLLERLVVLDLSTPLEYLLRLILALALLILDNAVGLFFDIIRFPFTLLSEFLKTVNLPTIVSFDELGQYLSFDLSTFTFRLGLNVSWKEVGTGAWLVAQFSVFGTNAFTFGDYRFTSLGLIGIQASLKGSFFGNTLLIPFRLSFQSFVQDTIEQWIETVGSPEGLFESIKDYLEGLGG